MRRALVVDDDRSLVRTLADVLRFKGWQVSSAYTGIDAVNAVAREEFDVVIMDYKMPGTDGVSAFRAIRTFRPNVRVVLMSAYIGYDVAAQAEREGVLKVMSKPVDITALLRVLTESLTRARPILLIDTDTPFLKSLAEVLALRGFDAVGAENYDDAMKLLKERTPTAVLMHLHGRNGSSPRDFVSRMKEQSPSAALVLYSGKPGAEEEAREWLRPGWMHAYLQKPFEVEEVAGVLEGIGVAT
jgi:DNA-binding NtrC family response regulator